MSSLLDRKTDRFVDLPLAVDGPHAVVVLDLRVTLVGLDLDDRLHLRAAVLPEHGLLRCEVVLLDGRHLEDRAAHPYVLLGELGTRATPAATGEQVCLCVTHVHLP